MNGECWNWQSASVTTASTLVTTTAADLFRDSREYVLNLFCIFRAANCANEHINSGSERSRVSVWFASDMQSRLPLIVLTVLFVGRAGSFEARGPETSGNDIMGLRAERHHLNFSLTPPRYKDSQTQPAGWR